MRYSSHSRVGIKFWVSKTFHIVDRVDFQILTEEKHKRMAQKLITLPQARAARAEVRTHQKFRRI